MKSFHVKSILLGIGIGIVLTSIISLIYSAGMKPDAEMSKVQIIAKAKEFGMVEGMLLSDGQTEKNDKDQTQSEKTQENNTAGTTASNAVDNAVEPVKQDNLTEVDIVVARGDTSEIVASKLLKSGLIDNKKKFIDKVRELQLSSKINIGTYKFNKNTGLEDIIKVLTEIKN